jgi:hypothetical protein
MCVIQSQWGIHGLQAGALNSGPAGRLGKDREPDAGTSGRKLEAGRCDPQVQYQCDQDDAA